MGDNEDNENTQEAEISELINQLSLKSAISFDSCISFCD